MVQPGSPLSLQHIMPSLGKAKNTFPAKVSPFSTEACELEKGSKTQRKDRKETEEEKLPQRAATHSK